MPRLFTALEVPREPALSLSLLRGGLPGARWVDGENFHITLRFFGDVEGHVADEIANALDRVQRHAFTMVAFRRRRVRGKKPHALWAGVTASPDLSALQAEIERKCQRLGLPADPRKFVPHVTLARLRNVGPHEVASYLSSRGNFASASFSCIPLRADVGARNRPAEDLTWSRKRGRSTEQATPTASTTWLRKHRGSSGRPSRSHPPRHNRDPARLSLSPAA